MNTRLQRWCAWSILPFLGFYIFALGGLAGFLPPPPPAESAPALAAFYAIHQQNIEIGQLLGIISSSLMLVWPAAVSAQMARIETGRLALLSIIQYVTAAILYAFFLLCGIIWSIAAFRPGINPDSLRLLNDSGWLTFVMAYPEYLVQLTCIAIVGLSDQRPVPFLPRWACYATIAIAFAGGGGLLSALLPNGVFAWNGLLGFWLPVATFVIWLVFIMLPFLLRAIKQEAAEGQNA